MRKKIKMKKKKEKDEEFFCRQINYEQSKKITR